MKCQHCGKEYANQLDFEAHCDWHDNLQTRLRRRHGRTFGARHKGKPAETEAQSSAIQEPIVNGGQEYASLSKFMAYDECFLFFRRFSALNIQSILHTQSELAKSEEQLRTVEEPLGNVENLSETEREAIEAERMQLMEEIQKKLESYNKALLSQSQLCTLEAPKAISVSDLRDWAKDYGHIDNPGCAFLANIKDIENDLVALVPKNDEKTWTYRVVEKLLWQAFATSTMGGKRVNFSGGGVLYTYDDDKIRRVVRGIITLVTAIFLVLPIIVLYFVKGGYEALVVVVVCTTAVAVVMAITTDCRNHEIMMAAAA